MQKTPEKIDRFDGEHRFLSNFYECPVAYDGLEYRNAEAAFQAAKCVKPEDRMSFTTLSPGAAKNAGRRVQLRPDWEDIKDRVMEEVVSAKFRQNPDLAAKLAATGDAELIEGNYWKDFYWGVCYGKGQNRLGQILMKVRAKLMLNRAYGTGATAADMDAALKEARKRCPAPPADTDTKGTEIKILLFKDSGKYYTEETVTLPAGIDQVWKAVEWLEANYKAYAGMALVATLDEMPNGYPIMIPGARR